MITTADIEARKLVNLIHIDMAKGESAWIGTVEGIPRLKHTRGYAPRHGRYVEWSVDDERVRDLQAALAVLNGTMTIEEAKKPHEKPVRTMKKFSLSQQIDEVERELGERNRVYDRLVKTGKMRQSVADFQLGRMLAVKATLEWLLEHETDIRAYVAAKAEARKKAEEEGRAA